MKLFLRDVLESISNMEDIDLNCVAGKRLRVFIKVLCKDKKEKLAKLIQYYQVLKTEYYEVRKKIIKEQGDDFDSYPEKVKKNLIMFEARTEIINQLLSIEMSLVGFNDTLKGVLELDSDQLFAEYLMEKVESYSFKKRFPSKVSSGDKVILKIKDEKIKKYFSVVHFVKNSLLDLEDELYENKDNKENFLIDFTTLVDNIYFFFDSLLCYEIDQRHSISLCSSGKNFNIKEDWKLVLEDEDQDQVIQAKA